MKKLLTILLTICALQANAQFKFNDGKATANMDTLGTRNDTLFLRNRVTGEIMYLIVENGETITTREKVAVQINDSNQLKLGINATAVNSNLFQGRDSDYVKANWGTMIDTTTEIETHYHAAQTYHPLYGANNLYFYASDITIGDYSYWDWKKLEFLNVNGKGVTTDTLGCIYNNIDTSLLVDNSLVSKRWVMDRIGSITESLYIADSSGIKAPIRALPTTYHPLNGLTTLNLSVDTIKARGKVKINDSTVIYLPQPQTSAGFQYSLFFGNGGQFLTHASGVQGQNNTAVGIGALYSITNGSANVAIGRLALSSATTTVGNVALGSGALQNVTTGSNNFGLGSNALNLGTTIARDIAIGTNCGQNQSTGFSNIFIGYQTARYGNHTYCTFIGDQSGYGVSNKGINQLREIKIGYQAGYTDTINDRLYIESSNSQTPLISGKFDEDKIGINKLITTTYDSTLNIGGGIDARGLKLSGNANIKKLQTDSIEAASGDLYIRNSSLTILGDYSFNAYNANITTDITCNSIASDSAFTRVNQLSAALTDGLPTASEINAAVGINAATAGIGYQVTIKDNNGTGLLYKIESDGTNWFYLVMTQAL